MAAPSSSCGKGYENQRTPDLGNGLYRNPVFPGDHPDPSVLKDGDDYYMVHSSFDVYPGLIIYHSRDLINWAPVGPALTTWIGSVWAPFLTKVDETYYIYVPARGAGKPTNYVITAPSIKGPWSEPLDLHKPLGPEFPSYIDPSHVIGEDGKRYLFVAGTHYMQLAPDGLSILPETFKVAVKDWPMPEEWVFESPAPEGPKVARVGEWFYLNVAQGGTAGPPTSHMTLSYRSRSVHGPWEFSPYNPVVYTKTPEDPWWSKGHGTLVPGPDGGASEWYLVFHGYEKDYCNLGRQTLMSPVVFTEDGWWRLADQDVSKPQPMPIVIPGEKHFNIPYSDDFSTDKFGIQWGFYSSKASTPPSGPSPSAPPRHRYEHTPTGSSLVIAGKGTGPADAEPLTFKTGDRAYSMAVKLTLLNPATSTAGALLFYNSKLYAGLGFDGHGALIMHRYGTDRYLPDRLPPTPAAADGSSPAAAPTSLLVRLVLDYVPTTLTMYYAVPPAVAGEAVRWKRFETQINVASYEHNASYDFLSLRPGVYAAGVGEVRVEAVEYEAKEVEVMENDIGLLHRVAAAKKEV
ncbi:xylosidase/arabinosidase, putative, gly43B [Zopfochytrium polystomum]|nr:xylosidase/arabinosidase, putative, gly43B [Zopfochytrium polystomum]